MKKSLCSHRAAFSAFSLAAILASHSAFAASSSWLASPVTAKWNNALNWSALPQSGDSLIFGASTQTVLTNDLTDASFVISGITVNAGAPGYSFSGNAFTLGTSTSGTIIASNVTSSSSSLSFSNNITLGNALQTISYGGAQISFSGNIGGAGSNSGIELRSSVLRSVNMSGTNTYTGDTVIRDAARLTLSPTASTSASVISSSSRLVMGDFASLYFNSKGGNSQTFNGFKLNQGAVQFGLSGNLTLNLGAIDRAAGGTFNIASIPQTSGTIVTTTSTNQNGILGAWATVGSGSPGATGANAAISLRYATVNASGQIVGYNEGTQVTGGASVMTDTTGTVNYDVVVTANSAITSGNVSVNTVRNASWGGYTTTLGGTLTTNGLMNGAAGVWTINNGIIKAGSNKELVIVSGNSGQSVGINSVIADSDSGASALVYSNFSGGSTLTLNAANTYSGATYINASTLSINAANRLGNSKDIYLSNATLSANAAFDLGSDRTLHIGGVGSGINASSALTVSGGVELSGSMTVAGAGAVTISGAISGEGGIVKNSASLLTLTGNNTYTGDTTITTGTLQLGDGTSGKDGAIASNSIVNNSALVINRFGNNSYSGAISGSGSVTKKGAGKQTLSGLSSFTGATTLNEGTLSVTGTLGSTSSVSASAGTVLGIDGRINTAATITSAGTVQGQGAAGALAISANGHLAAGKSLDNSNLGTLSATDVTFADSTTTFSIRLGVGGACDQLLLSGSLTLNMATLALDLSGVTFTGADIGRDFVIVNGGASLTGNGTNVFSQGTTYDAGNGTIFSINYATTANGTGVGNDVVLTLQAVPEPSTWAMIVGGVGMLAFGQRLRRFKL